MKRRLPTLEERRLWREVNRATVPFLPEDALEDAPPPAATPTKNAAAIPAPAALPRVSNSLSPLDALSLREGNKRFKSYPIDAVLDLHGATKLEARERVQQFIHHQHAAHRRHVLIITGKGRGSEIGVLRANLPDWLNEPACRALISAFGHARPEKGGTGVMHVLLKAR